MVAIESQKELDDIIRARLGSIKEQVTTNTGLKAASLGIAHRIDKGPNNLTTYAVREIIPVITSKNAFQLDWLIHSV